MAGAKLIEAMMARTPGIVIDSGPKKSDMLAEILAQNAGPGKYARTVGMTDGMAMAAGDIASALLLRDARKKDAEKEKSDKVDYDAMMMEALDAYTGGAESQRPNDAFTGPMEPVYGAEAAQIALQDNDNPNRDALINALRMRDVEINQDNAALAAELERRKELMGYQADLQNQRAADAQAFQASEAQKQRDFQTNMFGMKTLMEGRKPAKAPAGYKYAADGQTLEPIPGGPKDPNNRDSSFMKEKRKADDVLSRVEDAMGQYKATLQEEGDLDSWAVTDKGRGLMDKRGSAYLNLLMELKELYNLGVLNGPDLDIMQKVIKDPNDYWATFNRSKDDLIKQLDAVVVPKMEAARRKYQQNFQDQGREPAKVNVNNDPLFMR